ncbi:MAG: PQQ-binding-like beta-propeller repeat protein [Gemmataceae bacterium]
MPRWKWAAVVFALALLAPAAHGLIKDLTKLRDVVASYPVIFVARVEKVHPDKPAAVLKVADQLKGKMPFQQLNVNLTGDAEAVKEKQAGQLLKRIAPDLPIVIFANKQGQRPGDPYLAFAYSNGTWFQLSGRGDSDEKLVWSFNHFEPYFRRTFKGTTEELTKAVKDGLAGKKLPEPNEKEPPGLGPEVSPMPVNAGLPLGVVPTFVIIGPLAILAALFPTVFGGLAVMMKRWTAALSISSLVSTLYFAHAWFAERLAGTWWGTPTALWGTLAVVSALGAVWAGMRFRKALRDADFETFEPRKWDYLALALLSVAGLAGVAYVGWLGKPLLQSPWLDLVVSCVPVWVATAALPLARSGPERTVAFSLEAVFLWGLAVACGNVVALERGRGEGTGVQVVNATGRRMPRPVGEIWKFEPKGTGTVFSTPLIAGDRVYFSVAQSVGFTKFGSVYCLDVNSGAELWHFDNGRGPSDPVGLKELVSSPCLADGKIYIGEGFHQDTNCKLFCLEANTGNKLWEFQTSSHTESTPCVVDDKVYFGAGDDGVYCLNAADGKFVWNYPKVHVDAPPVVADGRLYVGSGVGDKYTTTLLFCLDAEKGTEIWNVPVDLPAFAPPALIGKQVYFGIGNGNMTASEKKNPRGALLCLDAETGEQKWRCDVIDTVLSQPAFDSDNVYFGARDEHCWCASRIDGRVKWKRPLGSPIVSSPILIADDAEFGTVRSLYVTTTGGRLACLDPDDGGEPFWSVELARHAKMPEAHVYATPAVVVRNSGGVQRRRIVLAAEVANNLTSLTRIYCFEDEVK